MSNITQKLALRMDSLENKYNPENDTIPHVPSVTYTDHELLGMIGMLMLAVDDLQEQLDSFKQIGF
jgi:hypothetical protein